MPLSTIPEEWTVSQNRACEQNREQHHTREIDGSPQGPGELVSLPTGVSRPLGGVSRLGFADRFGSEAIGWALHTSAALDQDVGVNHRRLHVPVAEKFLDRADVVVGVNESGGERVS